MIYIMHYGTESMKNYKPMAADTMNLCALSGTVKTGGSHNFAQYDLMVSITLCNVLCMYGNTL